MTANFVLPLLFLAVAADGTMALAQSPGTFAATGSMSTPRSQHTATLLTNGKVLFAGGSSNSVIATATAELYDPASGVFTITGSMTAPRSLHTATLLPDGRVLIAGGRAVSQDIVPTNSAEIYDPSTGTFAATGNLITGHVCQEATLLGNGKVLILGGDGANGQVPYAELYDPAIGTFAATGTYASDISGFNDCHGAVSALLPDGRVLMVWEEDAAEIYDPDAGSFTPTGKPIAQSYNDGLPTATLLINGKVLVAGGADDSGIHAGAELYDSSTGRFTATGNMSTGHAGHTATLLPDGSVLMAGTILFGGTTLARAELYDPVLGMFRPTGDMITARCCHTATLLNDGRVLIAGGNAGSGVSAELYTPGVLAPAPALCSLSGDGREQGAILHAATARVVTASDPAVSAEVLEIYGTGLKDGSVIPPQVAIGGRLAEILYFGNAPGFADLNQVNVRVPSGIAIGSAVLVRLTYLGRPSNAVTIAVR